MVHLNRLVRSMHLMINPGSKRPGVPKEGSPDGWNVVKGNMLGVAQACRPGTCRLGFDNRVRWLRRDPGGVTRRRNGCAFR